MRFTLFLFSFFTTFTLIAQPTQGLVSYFSFDNNDFNEESGNGQNGIFSNTVASFRCGVGDNSQSVAFNGISDQLVIFGLNNVFNTQDFTVSFYIKPEATLSNQVLLSKREDCSNNNAFGMTYIPSTNALDVLFSENGSKRISQRESLNMNKCWQHIVYIRQGAEALFYMNGTLVDEKSSVTRIDLTNASELVIGGGPCLSPSTIPFKGLLDEFRIYDRALNEDEIDDLFVRSEEIATQDTLIFLGTSIDIELFETCANNFLWEPSEGVDIVNSPNPRLTPTETTVYGISFDLIDCVATDSIRVVVVDPADLDCDDIFLPKAFTPNDDGKNDVYGLSNPFAVQELISFEIFDRWGGRVFYTTNAFDKWDGTFRQSEMNPGVFLYRVHYMCQGTENTAVGSVTLLR